MKKNLQKVFDYYSKYDPDPPKKSVGKVLSIIALLKFCYNYSIVDRYVKRKVLARVINSYGPFLNFTTFIDFLREISYEVYKHSNTITQTSKFKRFLSKLNLNNELDVRTLSKPLDRLFASEAQIEG